jgi:outer membrane protein OmpA-like peptidoglycan-associated protein
MIVRALWEIAMFGFARISNGKGFPAIFLIAITIYVHYVDRAQSYEIIHFRSAPTDRIYFITSVRNWIFFFDQDDDGLTPDSRQQLNYLSTMLKTRGCSTVDLTGHTDPTENSGKIEDNMALAKRRAETVAAAIAHHGFPRDQMRLFAKGGSQPLRPNNDRFERENPRVEAVPNRC